MQFQRNANQVTLTLSIDELRLLRRAFERASYIDTPADEQEDILNFCERALEALQSVENVPFKR